MHRISALWLALKAASVPAVLMLCVAVLAAIGSSRCNPLRRRAVRAVATALGAGAEGSRGMLRRSPRDDHGGGGRLLVTVVSLSLAASQYSPRVLRHTVARRHRPNQAVLGAFVASLPTPDRAAHHSRPRRRRVRAIGRRARGVVMARRRLPPRLLRAPRGLLYPGLVDPERIADETAEAIAPLPDELGDSADVAADGGGAQQGGPEHGQDIAAPCTGYLVGVDGNRSGPRGRARPRRADHSAHGRLRDRGPAGPGGCRCRRTGCTRLHGTARMPQLGRQRTVHRTVLWPAADRRRHIEALSPARTIRAPRSPHRQLGGSVRLASRGIPSRTSSKGVLRVIARDPTSRPCSHCPSTPSRITRATIVEVYARLIDVLGHIGEATQQRRRRIARARSMS